MTNDATYKSVTFTSPTEKLLVCHYICKSVSVQPTTHIRFDLHVPILLFILQFSYSNIYHSGWIAVVNDNLIGNCLSLIIVSVAIVMGLTGGLVGYIWAPVLSSSTNMTGSSMIMTLAILAAVIGAVVSQIFVNILDSAVAMVFVCYAENPDALKVRYIRVLYYE